MTETDVQAVADEVAEIYTLTLPDGSQLLIHHWGKGAVTVATRSWVGGTWGAPVEAVSA